MVVPDVVVISCSVVDAKPAVVGYVGVSVVVGGGVVNDDAGCEVTGIADEAGIVVKVVCASSDTVEPVAVDEPAALGTEGVVTVSFAAGSP